MTVLPGDLRGFREVPTLELRLKNCQLLACQGSWKGILGAGTELAKCCILITVNHVEVRKGVAKWGVCESGQLFL